MSAFYWFLLASIATWRITHLLQAEDGPWDVLVKLRALAGDSVFGKLLDCFYCLSLWMALPFACLVQGWPHRVVFWPGDVRSGHPFGTRHRRAARDSGGSLFRRAEGEERCAVTRNGQDSAGDSLYLRDHSWRHRQTIL